MNNFCGTVYREKDHWNFILAKEKLLGRQLTFEELTNADNEWQSLDLADKEKYQ